MAGEHLHDGGTRATQNVYTGPVRELTVDIDGHEIRVHDGVQAGGHRVLPLEANDLRYMAQNAEITAIAAMAKTPGFMVKKGGGSYANRVINGTAGELVVTNGSGYAGDVVLTLPDQITKNVDFTAGVTASGGFAGNLVGNVQGALTGNSAGVHTGNVIGNVTGNLTGNAIGAHSGSFAGDINVQGKNLLLDDGQIAYAKLGGTVMQLEDAGTVPVGGIIEWSGTVLAIPVNWALCDGDNGTPDLRGKFIIGAGDTGSPYLPADTGGAETHEHGTKTSTAAGVHTPAGAVSGTAITKANLPNIKLKNGLGINNSAYDRNGTASSTDNGYIVDMDSKSGGTIEATTEALGSGESHEHGFTGTEVADHEHDVVIAALSHLPPYYALAKIMRIT